MSDNHERLAREARLVRVYGAYVSVLMALSVLTLIFLAVPEPVALNGLSASAFFLCIIFAALYQYFSVRFLVNLGTRYDLMPIVKRSQLLQGWSNRPVYFYVCSMLSFLFGWASVLWSRL